MTLFLKGFLLGWSVAWPPGPVNAEMTRRGLSRGFWAAYSVGLGACSGDFLWALLVALGAGALAQGPRVRLVLGLASLLLLLLLAASFLRGAARAWRVSRGPPPRSAAPPPGAPGLARGVAYGVPNSSSSGRGYLLGFGLALSSPWNFAFWLAVVGQQERLSPAASLWLACSVVMGALAWGLVLCAALRLGARFATPAWEVTAQLATALLMLWFAARLALRLGAGLS